MEKITTFFEINKPLIETLAGIGTFISALIALYTLFEIRKQRRSTYKPELFLDSFCFYAVDNPILIGKGVIPKFQNQPYNEKKEERDAEESIFVNYKLENLGFGFAKAVECQWEFDFHKCIIELKKVMPKEYVWGKTLDFHTINNHTTGFYTSVTSSSLNTQKIDFIKPTDHGDNKKLHVFPSIYINTYVLYLIFKHDLTQKSCKNFYYEEFNSLPKIKLILTYKDLANGLYKKTLTISMKAASGGAEEVLDPTKKFAIFYVNVEE